jgi:hypothetical protein
MQASAFYSKATGRRKTPASFYLVKHPPRADASTADPEQAGQNALEPTFFL